MKHLEVLLELDVKNSLKIYVKNSSFTEVN